MQESLIPLAAEAGLSLTHMAMAFVIAHAARWSFTDTIRCTNCLAVSM
jgi:hypothetical protein